MSMRVHQNKKLKNSRNLPKDITVVEVDVKTETDLNELSNEERVEFMNEFNITEPALSKIIKTGYGLLDLKTFFTSVKKNQELGQQKSISMLMNVQVLYILISRKDLSEQRQFLTTTTLKVEVSKLQKLMAWRQEGKDYCHRRRCDLF